VFGGEHSGHFYFRDFWFADSGMLAALHTLAALGGQAAPLSGLLAEYSRYFASGELNSQVRDQAEATARVREVFARRPGVSTDSLDGLTVSADTWWFNLRPSNTEPLLRLNAEADTEATMAALRDEVLGVVAGPAHSGPAHSGPAHSGPAHSGPAHSGPADSGPADSGPADSGPADSSPAE